MSTKTVRKISVSDSLCGGLLLALAPIITAAGDAARPLIDKVRNATAQYIDIKGLMTMAAASALLMPVFAVRAGDNQSPGSLPGEVRLLASGLMGTIGSTIGPDGALYVAEGAVGRITRIDLSTGKATTFASGLPAAVPGVGLGGPMDVAFVGTTAYVLVAVVDSAVGGHQRDGIYRVDDGGNSTLLADLGTWSSNNPPDPIVPFNYFLPDGVQFALLPVDNGFLVSDGHLNRVLHVSKNGAEITVLKQFNDIVPTGLAKLGNTVFLAELGPVPETPDTGKVVSFGLSDTHPLAPAHVVASGVSMIVGTRFGAHGKLYALSQGIASAGIQPGQPASPDTGKLLRVNYDGTFTILADKLDRPASLNFVCDTAYIVTLTGEVWEVKGVGELADRDPTCSRCDHGP
jgi:hypothetical protein